MLLQQFLGQSGSFVEIGWEFHRAAQGIRDRRLARPGVLPVACHNAQLANHHLRQRRATCPRFLLRKAQSFRIQTDRQCRAHAREPTPFIRARQACRMLAAGLRRRRVERAGWPNRYIVFPGPLRIPAPNPTNAPNRCSLKPLTPETPEETLLLVLPQRRLALQVVCHSLPRFQLPKPSTWARQKQIPMCSLRSLTCLQVKVLPRQGMVGPSSDSRPWPGETLVRASSAVNGRACRRRRAVGGDWPAALANVQAATLRENCRPEIGSFSEANEEGNSEPPNHDRNGKGSHDRGISHQANLVSRRGRGSGMYGQYDKAKKGR